MRIQQRIGFGLVIALAAMVQIARGEDGRMSQDTLGQMGLGGLAVMSDVESESVRGQGFNGGGSHGSWAQASGSSFATMDSRYGNAHSDDDYSASGKHSASGNTNSYAGANTSTNHNRHGNDNGGGWGDGGSGSHNSGCDNRSCGGNSHPGNGNSNANCGNSHPSGGNSHPSGGSGNCGRTAGTSISVFAGGHSSAKAR